MTEFPFLGIALNIIAEVNVVFTYNMKMVNLHCVYTAHLSLKNEWTNCEKAHIKHLEVYTLFIQAIRNSRGFVWHRKDIFWNKPSALEKHEVTFRSLGQLRYTAIWVSVCICVRDHSEKSRSKSSQALMRSSYSIKALYCAAIWSLKITAKPQAQTAHANDSHINRHRTFFNNEVK